MTASTSSAAQVVEFQLLKVQGDTALDLTAPAIALNMHGSFQLSVGGSSSVLAPGEAASLDAEGVLGNGRGRALHRRRDPDATLARPRLMFMMTDVGIPREPRPCDASRGGDEGWPT